MAALGNSEDGVTQNPSALRQENASQLGQVRIIDRSFTFDSAANPTAVTVRFELAERADTRTLHLASFVLPGPFTEEEIPQQELYDVANGTYQGGESGQLTVAVPPHTQSSGYLPQWIPGLPIFGFGTIAVGATALLISRQ